jgi:hypothetical protein
MNNLLPKIKEFYKTKHFEDGGIERLPDGRIKVTMCFSDDDTERISKENTYNSNTNFYISYGLFMLILISILLLPCVIIINSWKYIFAIAIFYLIGLTLIAIGIYRKLKVRL